MPHEAAQPQCGQPRPTLYDSGQQRSELGGCGRFEFSSLLATPQTLATMALLVGINHVGLAVPQPHHQVGNAGVMERPPRAAGLAYGLLRRRMKVFPCGTGDLEEGVGGDLQQGRACAGPRVTPKRVQFGP